MLVRAIPDVSLCILTVGLSHFNIWGELLRQPLLTRVSRILWLAALLLAVLGEKNGSLKNLGHSLKQEEMLAACSQHWERMERKKICQQKEQIQTSIWKIKLNEVMDSPLTFPGCWIPNASHCPCCLSRCTRYSLADLQYLQCKPNLVRSRWYSF